VETPMTIPVVNHASPAFKASPYPFYAHLRAESPVSAVTLADKRTAWLVTRYDDVVNVLRDHRFAKDRFRTLNRDQLRMEPWIPKMFKPLAHNMLDQDPPDHTRLRPLVQKVFTPRLVESLRGRIQSLTEGLLDAVRPRGHMDLIRDYALPLPSTVIAEILGIPVADRHKFHRWSSAILSSDMSRWQVLKMFPSMAAFLRYIRKLIASCRRTSGYDLASMLVAAEEAGDKLSEDELLAMIFLLLLAGHETTVNLIGNGTLALLQNPAQLEKLRNDRGLTKSAVEELLRFDSPLETATERFAREDVAAAGTTIPQGSLVLAVLASANRDDRQFRDPDVLNLAREDNKHVAFGLGIHYRLGAPLARLEGQSAFNTLLRFAPGLRLAVPAQKLRWKRGLVLRGLKSLPVVLRD
jgi:cytochrome P450